MGDLVPFTATPKTILKQIRREAAREAQELYRLSAGFADPLPPSPEQREMFEQGFTELHWGFED